jgi:hypothetical protein
MLLLLLTALQSSKLDERVAVACCRAYSAVLRLCMTILVYNLQYGTVCKKLFLTILYVALLLYSYCCLATAGDV